MAWVNPNPNPNPKEYEMRRCETNIRLTSYYIEDIGLKLFQMDFFISILSFLLIVVLLSFTHGQIRPEEEYVQATPTRRLLLPLGVYCLLLFAFSLLLLLSSLFTKPMFQVLRRNAHKDD